MTERILTIDTSRMTETRRKEFALYVEALAAVFEVNDNAIHVRTWMRRNGDENASAFVIAMVPDDIGEGGRMAILSEIGRRTDRRNEVTTRETSIIVGDVVMWQGQSDRRWVVVSIDADVFGDRPALVHVRSGDDRQTFRASECRRAFTQAGQS